MFRGMCLISCEPEGSGDVVYDAGRLVRLPAVTKGDGLALGAGSIRAPALTVKAVASPSVSRRRCPLI
jgi:hypothetical protein